MAIQFSDLSEDLVIMILDKLSSNPHEGPPSKFSILAAFSRASRQCARACRSRGWERACKSVFPALEHLFPENRESEQFHWAALARLLSWFPGHGEKKGQPVLRVEKCKPKALVRRPCRVQPSQVVGDWEESLMKGAGILGPLIEKTNDAMQVFLLQDESCLADNYCLTGPEWEFNCLTIFWGFVAGLIHLDRPELALQDTGFVCPFCPALMRQIPSDCVATEKIDPKVVPQVMPEFYVCCQGHVYGFAACDSPYCQYFCEWWCHKCPAYPCPGQTGGHVPRRCFCHISHVTKADEFTENGVDHQESQELYPAIDNEDEG